MPFAPRSSMMRTPSLCVLVLLAACQRGDEPRGAAAPPAAAIAPIGGARLSDALELMDRELVAAIRGGLEGEGLDSFLRAEAISDRLQETRYPFRQLRSGNYSVDARLRQIQALADRVLAQLRSGESRDAVSRDLQLLRRTVLELRMALAEGGGPAPVPLERLLAGRDTLDLDAGEGSGTE